MKCRKCGGGRFRYTQRNPNKEKMRGKKKEEFKRTDFSGKCQDCKFEGEDNE